MAQYIRTDQAQINVEVPGVAFDKESWDVLEGGDNVAEEASVFPGGMKPLVQLGGFPKRSAITVMRPWADTLVPLYKALDAAVGRHLHHFAPESDFLCNGDLADHLVVGKKVSRDGIPAC